MSYPDPCNVCTKARCVTNGCVDWRIRYLFRQKQINLYARKLLQGGSHKTGEAFRYEHPDIIRRYLKNGPCRGCNAEAVCDTPCPAYWRWWDEKMEEFRGRLGKC
ncbi:MAG: hypothetical protein J6C98_07800 [Oscillospiraceae bacterium]|nr:hypothetical protein [Oscillospiraceae bacterium]